jgi:hypothetical protein
MTNERFVPPQPGQIGPEGLTSASSESASSSPQPLPFSSAGAACSEGGADSQFRPYAALLAHSEIPGWESIPMDLREAVGVLISRHAEVFLDHRECAFVAALVVWATRKGLI